MAYSCRPTLYHKLTRHSKAYNRRIRIISMFCRMCHGNLIAPSNSCCSFSCVIQSSSAPAEISALVWKAWPFWSCSTLPTSRSAEEPLFLHALSCLYCSISGSDGLTWSQISSCPAAIIFFQCRFLVTPFTCFQVSYSILRRTAIHLLAGSCSVGIPSRYGRSSTFFSRFRRWKDISFSGKTLDKNSSEASILRSIARVCSVAVSKTVLAICG